MADDLEPLHRIARSVLDTSDIHTAHVLIGFQNGRDVLRLVSGDVKLACQFNRVIDGELGAGADSEMGRVGALSPIRTTWLLPLK